MRSITHLLLAAIVVPATGLDAQTPAPGWESRHRERIALETIGSAVGAVGTSVAFAFVGAGTASSGGEDPGLVEAVVGAMAGSVIGASIGATAVGRLTHDSGKLGSAFLGSVAGFCVFLMMVPSLDADYVPFYLAFWGLPTVGAVTAYNLSRDPENHRSPEMPPGRVRLSVRPHANGVAVGLRVGF